MNGIAFVMLGAIVDKLASQCDSVALGASHTVTELEMQYMCAQLVKAGTPGPRAIGVEEISIRKGRACRIAASDFIRDRPIW